MVEVFNLTLWNSVIERALTTTPVLPAVASCCNLPWGVHIMAFDAHRVRVVEAHSDLLAELDADGTDAVILTLHRPLNLDCTGCDKWGPEPDDPPWPCRTYRLVAEIHKRVFVDTPHGVEMEKR